ncbi:MAG: hypothetical protein RR454_02020 [Clostridia bacterium]
MKNYFAAANTPKGFFSFYDNLIDYDTAKTIISLKGGSGVGKSTFMKQISSIAEQKGYDYDYIYCSSDKNSLDCVKIDCINLVVLDGTAPHLVDPNYPGAVGEIVNLGRYLDKNKLLAYKDKIVEITLEKKKHYSMLYNSLAAAKSIYDNYKIINEPYIINDELHNIANDIYYRFIENIETPKKPSSHRFISALTPKGFFNFVDSLAKDKIVINLETTFYPCAKKIIALLLKKIDSELYTEQYHCVLEPDEVEHFIIGNVLVTTNHKDLTKYSYDLDTSCINDKNEYAYNTLSNKQKELYEQVLLNAQQQLGVTQALHKELEDIYISAMDFVDMNKEKTRIIEKIFE